MSIIDRLLGRRPDPTIDWPKIPVEAPDLDLDRMSFAPLRFGDSLEAARFLGRPDTFRWTKGDYCELLYARAGFQLDFDRGRFVYLAFFIGPDACLLSHPQLAFSEPRILGRVRLTQHTGRKQLQNYFGSPESEDKDDQETILYYSRGGVTMEFELDVKERLKRWNLYPKDDVA